MSKRPHNSQASASEDLVKRLKAAANDAELVRKIVGSSDIASNSDAFITLLAGGTSSAVNGAELRKKAHNRPCRLLPTETFLEVVRFADRDTLDAMQGVCSFLLSFIRERELTQLALRAIPRIEIGEYFDYNRDEEDSDDEDDYDGWLPTIEMEYNRGAGKRLAPRTIHQLTSCLRMAFCKSVCIEFGMIDDPDTELTFDDVWGMIFDDLVAQSTFVGNLDIDWPRQCKVELAVRGILAFKSVKRVNVISFKTHADQKPLDESFFVPAAERGVRHIEHYKGRREVSASTAAALAFGFAESTAGGDRSLFGIDCGAGPDFLAQVKQKASELPRDVDFTFKITTRMSPRIDSTGFEKYERDDDDGRTWLMNDLENLVNVEVTYIEDKDVEDTKNVLEIHVFSSV